MLTTDSGVNIVPRVTSGMLAIGLAVGVLAGVAWARALHALTNLRDKRSGIPKAKTALSEARALWWKAIRAALAAAAIAMLYVYATSTVAATSPEEECERDCPLPSPSAEAQ